ncbi:hypothetical protein OIU84_021316 [Salix udensis]|uniref:Bet v I/Major latex protein domain-containing protein n=1 Tax=Salix udensis TaxID=889485 RepID=A0AAD6PHE7_9ROSI|nr:hypothetical protein OIU84_021316 [Salix udensis]
MAQIATLEVQTEIKSSADQFYEIFRSKQYLMPKICPEYIKGVQVVQGDWEAVGSIKLWTYVAGSSEIVKDTVEAIDDKTKSITYNILEGKNPDILQGLQVHCSGYDNGSNRLRKMDCGI